MDLQGFEIISTNCDILLLIYKMLNSEDQLRLAQVNGDTRIIFENFIWIADYKTLTVLKEEGNSYEVSNKLGAHRLVIKENSLHDFLKLYQEKVQELFTEIVIRNLKPFTNLTKLIGRLCYRDMCTFLKYAARHLKQLQHLELEGVSKLMKSLDIVVGSEVVESLLQLENVKLLRLDFTKIARLAIIENKFFQQIVAKDNLEILILKNILPSSDKHGQRKNSFIVYTTQMKELDFWTALEHWNLHPIQFENLVVLQLCFEIELCNRILARIAAACLNLEQLTMVQTYFKNIYSFLLPEKLRELHLDRCYGLTQANLKQILSKTGITEFTSNATPFRGDFYDFQISLLIQTLAVDGLDMNKFLSAYHNNVNLKNLKWSRSNWCLEIFEVTSVPLGSCVNLEILDMNYGSRLDLDILSRLRHLRKFTTYIWMDWSYLIALLKHPPLRELNVSFNADAILLPKAGSFATEVTEVNVKLHEASSCILDFFLDLFSHNADEMSLSFSVLGLTWKEYLRVLLNHTKFPEGLKTIHVGDLKINYKTLTVLKEEGNSYEVSNKLGAHRLVIKENSLHDFLKLYQEKVQELFTEIVIRNLKPFTNLTKLIGRLCYRDMCTFLKYAARHLKQLQHLELEGVSKLMKSLDIVVGSEVVESLLQLENVKLLRLDFTKIARLAIIENKFFQQIVAKDNLEILILKNILPSSDKHGQRKNSFIVYTTQMKELDFWTALEHWNLHPIQFENLVVLQLCFEIELCNRILARIAAACLNLEQLTMVQTYFKNIYSFLLPEKLRELHLDRCYGLTQANLKQILSKTGITEFTSNATPFRGDFYDFQISLLIQTLAVDGLHMNKFLSAYHNNVNLKNLKWSRSNWCLEIFEVTSVPLGSCVNLEILDMNYGSRLDLDILSRLRHLRKFTTYIWMDWSYLIALLKHPPLRELNVSFKADANLLPKAGSFATEVTEVNVKLRLQASSCILDFFLDLFSHNADEMSLSFSVLGLTWKEYLRVLLNHTKFPEGLKTIHVGDLKINFNDFMRNFDSAAEKFRCVPFHMECSDYWRDIILLNRKF